MEIEDLHAFYGKSHVLHGLDLVVGAGEIVSLLGRNGVGRSTTLKAVIGQVKAHGSIRFKGGQMLGLKPFQIARHGIGYVPENRDIFPTLSVQQNLILGQKSVQKHAKPARWQLQDMYRMFPVLEQRKDAAAGVLSGGEQQMLTLCRSLMGDPDLIMIDEPTEGLAPKIVAQLADFLRQLKEQGLSVLLVEQKLAIALDISQRVLVMGHGAAVFEGTPQALLDNVAIRREWLAV
ncbi:MAG: ABC transporter ATP-binding protein [Pseudomonadota bacterium]